VRLKNMESSRSNINQWISRILLIAIIAISAVLLYALNEIDRIINVQLYDYQLQFSLDWANPYWGFTQIIYVSIGITMILSAVILLLGFVKPKKATQPLSTLKSSQKPIQTTPLPIYTKPKTQQPKPAEITIIQHNPEPATTQTIKAKPVEIKTKTNKTAVTTTTETAQATSTCPSCKKGFSQPLVMLDFEGGKSKLVNVCPYCNQVLSDKEQKNEE